MTKLVEQAVAAISKLPSETQDDLARFLLSVADSAPLTVDETAAIAEAEAQIGRRERVAPNVIKAFWGKHGL